MAHGEVTPLAEPGRKAWVHVVRGSAAVNGHRLEAGDALGLEGEPSIKIEHGRAAEVLVFDLQ